MSSDANQPAAATRARILTILWLAFLTAVGLYAVVLFFILSSNEAAPAQTAEALRQAFLTVGAVLAVACLWWRRRFASPAAAPAVPRPTDVSEKNTMGETIRRCVVAWAMADAIAVLGLVLAILSREVDDFLPFAAAAVVVLYLNRPAVWPTPSGTGESR
jgi:F0F1-type ATP synthase membrane subunit c/vacuolar-type H+-ATPase subunit K